MKICIPTLSRHFPAPRPQFGTMDEEYEWLRFKEDSPLVRNQVS